MPYLFSVRAPVALARPADVVTVTLLVLTGTKLTGPAAVPRVNVPSRTGRSMLWAPPAVAVEINTGALASVAPNPGLPAAVGPTAADVAPSTAGRSVVSVVLLMTELIRNRWPLSVYVWPAALDVKKYPTRRAF